MLMVMGTALQTYAIESNKMDLNSVKYGNEIRGHVIDKQTKEHLSYATILIVETGEGTVSDETGHFKLHTIPDGTYTLRVQLLGYATQEKKVTVKQMDEE